MDSKLLKELHGLLNDIFKRRMEEYEFMSKSVKENNNVGYIHSTAKYDVLYDIEKTILKIVNKYDEEL